MRETNAVATLQEVAFITIKNDVAKYNAKADEVARKAAERILSYFGQKFPATKSSSVSNPPLPLQVQIRVRTTLRTPEK